MLSIRIKDKQMRVKTASQQKAGNLHTTYSVLRKTPVGEIKIPEPIIVPIMIPTPLNNVILRFNTTFSSPACDSSPITQKINRSPVNRSTWVKPTIYDDREETLVSDTTGHTATVSLTRLTHFLLPFLRSTRLE